METTTLLLNLCGSLGVKNEHRILVATSLSYYIFLENLLSIFLMLSIFKETVVHTFTLVFCAPFMCFDFIA